MRTKRKNYDYHSSDYGNEDYGQDDYEGDDFDDDEPIAESEGDSAYGESGDERQVRQAPGTAKAKRIKNEQEAFHEEEETYEDEDPFSPEIDMILADKLVDVPTQDTSQQTQNQARPARGTQFSQQPKQQQWYLVKFMDQSYLHVKWIEENQLDEYSYRAKQKIRRYWIQKEKKKAQQELAQKQTIVIKPRNHHFSEDEEEEEDEDAAIRGISLPEIASIAEEPVEQEKPQYIKVEDRGEDLTQYFEKNFIVVERVLSTTMIFPIIHPRQAKQIKGKWQDDCLKVINILVNLRKNNVCIGLTFAEQLDPENEELADYFKIVKQPMDLIMIMNRLYNKYYQSPNDFWNDLGLVFKNCRSYYKSTKLGIRKQCEALRCLAFYLYKDWYQEQKTRFQTGVAIMPPASAPYPSTQEHQSYPQNQSQNIQDQISNQNQNQFNTPVIQQKERDPTIVNLTSLIQSEPTQPQNTQQQDLMPTNQMNQYLSLPSMNQVPSQQDYFWNALTTPQPQQPNFVNMSERQQNYELQQQQYMMPPPSLPKVSSIFNGMPQGAKDTIQKVKQLNPLLYNQSMNDLIMSFNAQGQVAHNYQERQGMNFNQNNQSEYSNDDQNILRQFFGQNSQGQNDMSYGSNPISTGQNQFLQQQNPMLGQNQMNPNFGNQSTDFSQLGGVNTNPYQTDYNTNMMNQMMGMNNQGMMPMGQGGQDFGNLGMKSGMLPSMSTLPSLTNQFSLQLPSLNQLVAGNMNAPNFNSQYAYGDLQPQNMMQGMMNQQNNMLQKMNQFNQNQGMNSFTTNDYSQMLSQNQNMGMNPQQYNQYGFNDNVNQQQNMFFGMNNQFSQPQQNQLMNFNQSMYPKDQQQQQRMFNQQQSMDPHNLMQPDENFNDKQDAPVPPAIIDPGQFDLSWLLDRGEKPEDLNTYTYITKEEVEQCINNKHTVDQLYLIKWKALSYTQSTWEQESKIRGIYDEKIQDYMRFNRSLDQFQRDRMDQLIKNHKKMLRITEKKYQTGKKVDANQENFLSLQEAKINRQLLSYKIQELMGNAFHQLIQYNYERGFVPQFKKANQLLKDYQVIGLNWLIRAWHEHRNVVLADEMGLGKTIMTLALFDHLNKMYKLRGPFLILAPLTTLEHWKRIADEWTTLNSVLYYDAGSAEGRQEIRQWEWFFTDVTYKGTITQKSELYKFNLMITSFEVFMQDLNPILQEIPFIYIVVDEAHRLKNKQAKTLKLLKDHSCKRILLLTGTPVQNNTKELWTLLNYIEPEKFSSLELFLDEFGNLETYDQITKLHTILKPHFLRRLKEEVDNSIPPLQETVIEVGLTTLQNQFYKGIYGENRMVLAKFGANAIKSSQLNNIDVQLRKCCNHLFLLKGVEEELTKECKNEQDYYKKLLESSGKLMLLDKFIEKFKQENHKMLIFSQFKRMLEIIELYLRMKGVPFELLTGSVKTQDRIASIQRFNDDKTFGVFLLTTRAGGLGINLTSARVVIIFDSDWNPQNDLQAIARAHRIGQKFEVQVYRLITTKTYEEQMFERASKKLGMEQALFSKGAFNQRNEEEIPGFTLRGLTDLKQDSKEIENLLKYGAYAFIDNDKEEDQNQFNKDIDEILATGKKKEFSYNKGIYTLQKSTFNASKYENLPDLDDPDFWNKVLPYESIMSISVLEKKFKKEKKEMSQNEKILKEFIKDLEIVFNDFMDAKFDVKTSAATKKQLESDEEKLREILKKLIKLNGIKLMYVERCKEWLREMLRTNKRKKPQRQQINGADMESNPLVDDDDDPEAGLEDDDIIIDDSDEQFDHPSSGRNLRKRNQRESNNPQQRQGDSSSKGKRGRKPANWGKQGGANTTASARKALKRKGGNEEQSDYDDEEDPYGDEEEGNEFSQEYGDENNGDEQYDENDDDVENRYGLRGRKKRQKTDKDDYFTPQQRQNMPKINDQFAKRNEKNGIVCSYCLHPEPPYCSWFCHGYCQRFFHDECKETLFSNLNTNSESQKKYKIANNSNKGTWVCDDCLDSKAQCFCCKQKGKILLFPKKGKPKAAEQLENLLNPSIDYLEGDEDQEGDEDLENGEEDYEDDIEDEQAKIEGQEESKEIKDKSQDKVSESKVNEEQDTDEMQGSQQDLDGEVKNPLIIQPSPGKIVINTSLLNDPEQPNETEQDEDKPLEQQDEQLQKQPSTKIVLPNISFKQPEVSTETKPKPQKEPEQDENQFVVRCTLGGCFKYYHVNCVYKNKNVSCINSMKVQRFRCPLHYCEKCQASGDSVLIVQCVTCPTAYHLKCLPQDINAIRLTKKYIICGKHNMSSEDFPRYEEKAAMLLSQQGIAKLNQQSKGPKDKRKKKLKKRGRRPKSSLADEDYGSEQVNSSPKSKSIANVEGSTSFVISLPDNRSYGSQQQQIQQRQQHSRDTPKPLFTVEKHFRHPK